MRHRTFLLRVCLGILCVVLSSVATVAQQSGKRDIWLTVDEKVKEWMEAGDIPGLTLVVVQGNKTVIRCFGYADLDQQIVVTPATTFELASCSKSFTALAALELAEHRRINLDAPVSAYLPDFFATYQGKRADITIRQLLHHTSGINWNTITAIPEGNGEQALAQTVRNVSGTELLHLPGKVHHYATVNYDIIGAIIEKVTGLAYEKYMEQRVFTPLGLSSTYVGTKAGVSTLANGYKVGFSMPLDYDAPTYRGNYPAGYINSTGADMARWLKLQMGFVPNQLDSLIAITHRRDETVPPDKDFLTSYAMGWEVSLRGEGEISHEGLNPTFAASVKLFPADSLGIAVLANSNSNYTYSIANYVSLQLRGEAVDKLPVLENEEDRMYSILALVLGLYCVCLLLYCLYIGMHLVKRQRVYQPLSWPRIYKLVLVLLVLAPLVMGIYLLPKVVSGVTWQTALVWSPVSFFMAICLALVAILFMYGAYFLSMLFPFKKKYQNEIPLLVVLSLLSGIANAGIIFLIVNSLQTDIKVWYLLFYLSVALFLYITGRKVVETKLTQMALDLIYQIRIQLIDKIFLTSFQNFEQIDRGQVYATLNDDTNGIGNSVKITVEVITSSITIIFAFLYLGFISGWATLLTLGTIFLVATIYHFTSQQSEVFFEKVRDTRNSYMRLINGLLDGFKELSLHRTKKEAYKEDMHQTADSFRHDLAKAQIKFIDSFLVGESLLVIVLMTIVLGFPTLFPQVATQKLAGFIMVLLYLIGPITAVLNAIPSLIELKVSWNRINQFIERMPAVPENRVAGQAFSETSLSTLESFKAEGVAFTYQTEHTEFAVGPISFEINRGEIFFIAGGNGSGKTTLAKLITGLYPVDSGTFKINGCSVPNTSLGEHFSVVFGDFYLFEKLYAINCSTRQSQIQELLQLLELETKVSIVNNAFSTIQLSQGQRKRLALLRCYLEDKPIYLFDEWAADQDVEFKRFFYEELLMQMKKEGKMVIAITHDDQYYEKADKIMFLEYGKVKSLKAKAQVYL